MPSNKTKYSYNEIGTKPLMQTYRCFQNLIKNQTETVLSLNLSVEHHYSHELNLLYEGTFHENNAKATVPNVVLEI